MNRVGDDFESFRDARRRFFDLLAAESLLFNIERRCLTSQDDTADPETFEPLDGDAPPRTEEERP